ncbi:MAG: hypothetical protein EBX50_06230 [Chitinophagia bacterium]|nr:hypothetical protein [Chitinophagia bacterium]
MEVHHSHHPTHKKKWTEYLLEFFMLFFAVSLGFLAENIREHYVERERAHQLIAQFKKDIRNNIHLIDSVVNRDKGLVQKFDSAIVYLISNKDIDADSLFNNLPPTVFRFISKNDTYDQMKNSGSLRYIKDFDLLDQILDYANDCTAAETRSNDMEAGFVLGEYSAILDRWTPKSVALRGFLKVRTQITSSVISNENMSQLMVTENTEKLLTPVVSFQEKVIYTGEKAEALKNLLIPYITRRSSLLMNTVRFMGRTKRSGEELLAYIEKQEH